MSDHETRNEHDDELRDLWRAQKTEEPKLPTEEKMEIVRKRDASLALKVKIRNVSETAAGVFVVGMFTWMALTAPWQEGQAKPPAALVARAGCLLVAAGAVYAVMRLRSHGTSIPAPPSSATTSEFLAHHRAQLVRQRDLLASVPRWYLAPFVPGMALFIAGVTLDRLAAGATMAAIAPGLARGVGEIVGIFALVALLNYVTARKLTRAIAALDD
jgi:hypothetical protein